MSYFNVFLPKANAENMTDFGSNQGKGQETGSVTATSKNMNKITVFGLTMLIIYTITKILNFYGIGVDKSGSYLVFYVFLIICVNVMDTDNPKA